MYTILATINVTPGMLAEYDAYSERFLAYAKRVPGMRSYVQSADPGHPGRFVMASTLDSRRHAVAWLRSPDLKAILQQAVAGMVALVGEPEGWEDVAATATSLAASQLVNARFTVSTAAGSYESFEAQAREWIALYEEHGCGLAFARMLRLAGNRSRYLLQLGFTTAEDAAATFAAPAIVQARREHPLRASAAGEPEVTFVEVVRSAVIQPATVG